MNLLKDFFKPKQKYGLVDIPISVDMHSHLLPGIDDGVDSVEESLDLIRRLSELGYRKLIATPHVMGDFYQNSPEIIQDALETVQQAVKAEGLPVEMEASGEYYMDEWFLEKVANNNVLSFGDEYLLVETSFMNRPNQLFESFFQIKLKGFKPVFAHPERYIYLYEDFERFKEIYKKGVYFQINLNSLTGYYSPNAKYFAERLIKQGMVDFVGTDTHRSNHVDLLPKAMESKAFPKLKELTLLNESL